MSATRNYESDATMGYGRTRSGLVTTMQHIQMSAMLQWSPAYWKSELLLVRSQRRTRLQHCLLVSDYSR
jgi:hypothetical protein